MCPCVLMLVVFIFLVNSDQSASFPVQTQHQKSEITDYLLQIKQP